MNQSCREFFEAENAGLEPGTVNRVAVEALQEIRVDISPNKAQSVFDVCKSGKMLTYVVTVCSEAEAGCPIFDGVTIVSIGLFLIRPDLKVLSLKGSSALARCGT